MVASAGDLLDQLDERAVALESLLDRHPGRHLLAEYETTILECPGFCPAHAADLLTRIQQMISELSAIPSNERRFHDRP
jgi:hypothetical protein